MKLILIRHGETLWNRENRIQGHTDVELSDLGRLQVEKLSLSLKKERIEAIFSSPLRRAYETAQAIARFHNLNISIEENLRELNHGDFESLTLQDLKEQHESFLKKWKEDPASVVMPNGESLFQVQERVWETIKTIIHSEKDTLVVSHGMALMTLLCKIQNLSLSKGREVFVTMASKTVVQFDDGKGVITIFNDASHLNDM